MNLQSIVNYMNYYDISSAINTNDNTLSIYGLNIGEELLKLRHINDICIENYKFVQIKTFDTEYELIEFINEKYIQETRNTNIYFSYLAYEIIDEHYIKLYYNWYVSNS